MIRKIIQQIWRAIPASAQTRGRIASALFRAAPFLFFRTQEYQAWRKAKQEKRSTECLKDTRSLNPPIDPSLDGYVEKTQKKPPEDLRARALAFYLPQYHEIPENNEWWGQGFTEWTKVKPAQPLFSGHHQPNVPGELGYYDLVADPSIMARQADLAKLYGLSGFCFYFYWFAGKTLLEAPIQNFHSSSSIDFPFCLCWANENWSRRWDGRADHILIAQEHTADDDIAFIEHISRFLKNPRYIKIDGKPLLIVYRPALLPNAKETASRWRNWCAEHGIGEIFLASTQAFESDSPDEYGFDASIEFPPNNSGLEIEPELVDTFAEGVDLSIYDWRKIAGRSLNYQKTNYPLYRGVTPAWDNTPRRPKDGAVLLGSSPSAYHEWLKNAVRNTELRFSNPEARLVFINAWNEWAEGAYLEPDKRRGYAYLEASRRALDAGSTKKMLVVIHDLHPHGAQFGALHLMQTLKNRFGYDVAAISGGDGRLAAEFRELGPLEIINPKNLNEKELVQHAQNFQQDGFGHALVNSSAAGWVTPYLKQAGIRSVGLVHEMPYMIERMGLEKNLHAFNEHSEAVVFPARLVMEKAAEASVISAWRNPIIAPQGHYKKDSIDNYASKEKYRKELCKLHGLPDDARIVIGAGYGDHRKGVDIFADWAVAAARKWDDVYFFWLGDVDTDMRAAADERVNGANLNGERLQFPGFIKKTALYYRAASIFALSSREDPFPTTVLEALACATPAIVVRGATGIGELAGESCVEVIETSGADKFIAAASRLLNDDELLQKSSRDARDLVASKFGYTSYVSELINLVGASTPRVSAVVPNFNYAKYLPQRLKSILDQTLVPTEIIVLDDASTDESLSVIQKELAGCDINWRLIRNEQNSGDVFAQWRKGVTEATGDLVWIAEADDWADPRFLEVAVKAFEGKNVVLSYAESNQIDRAGRVLSRSYSDYVGDISKDRWRSDYRCDGAQEIAQALSVKNTIPNVSAVVFRKRALHKVLQEYADEISSYRVAGDWCVYVHILQHGAVSFSSEALNYHRRHESSVTLNRFDLDDLAEIVRMQTYVLHKFDTTEDTAISQLKYLHTLIKHFRLDEKFTENEIQGAIHDASADFLAKNT